MAAIPFAGYTELVTVAFGAAWRRHWLYDDLLAPSLSRSKWRSWFQGKNTREGLRQVRERLTSGNFAASLPGDGDVRAGLELSSYCDNALGSRWYRALWRAFNEPRMDDDEGNRVHCCSSSTGGGGKTAVSLSVTSGWRFERH